MKKITFLYAFLCLFTLGLHAKSHLDLSKKNNFFDNPQLSLVLTGMLNGTGGQINYSYHIVNTGDVPLHNITISNPSLGMASVPVTQVLGPGSIFAITIIYTVTAADLASGSVITSAVVTGNTMDGTPVSDISDGASYTANNPTVTILGSAALNNDLATTTQNSGSINIPILQNDILPNNGQGAVLSVYSAVYGSVTVNTNGTPAISDDTVTYTTPLDFVGTDSFIYTVVIGGQTFQASVDVTITAANPTPVLIANNDVTPNYSTLYGGYFGAFGNDTLNGQPVNCTMVTATLVESPSNLITIAPCGFVSVQPGLPPGTYTMYYKICLNDNSGTCSTASVTITLTAPVAQMVANNDFFSVGSGAAQLHVLANDTFISMSGGLSLNQQPSHGSCLIQTNGTLSPTDDFITYTPNPGYNGGDFFTYNISDGQGMYKTGSVYLSVGTATTPTAANDTMTTSQDTSSNIDVLTNDNVGSNGPAIGNFIAITTLPENGTGLVNPNGTITYTPNPNYSGADAFSYTFTDANGQTATATVFVAVTEDSSGDEPPVAVYDNALVEQDDSVTINVLANDTFGAFGPLPQPITATQGEHGSVSVNINGTPDDPTDDTITYTPNLGYNGVDNFYYTIANFYGQTATGMVTVTIVPPTVVDDLVALNDTTDWTLNGPISVHMLANDTLGSDNLAGGSIVISTAPLHGTTVLNDNGTPGMFDDYITYTPANNFAGTDTLSYTLTNAYGESTTATITFKVSIKILVTIFKDVNGDGQYDPNTEPQFYNGNLSVQTNNTPQVIYSNFGGTHTVDVYDSSNTYSFGYAPNAPQYNVVATPFLPSVPLNSENGIVNVYFTVASSAYTDAKISIYQLSQARPGFEHTYVLSYQNIGNVIIPSATLTFIKPSILQNLSYGIPGAIANPTGFTAPITNLYPGDTTSFTVTGTIPTIPTVSLGQVITASASLTVDDDAFTANNAFTLNSVIVGSYDPNDMYETHGGKVVAENFTSSDYLYYTIRFENTGTAAAETVRVENTLDSQLDPSTVMMVHADHNYELERIGNQLTWTFSNINLPPSVEQLSNGKGYIIYAVKPFPGYAVGNIIPNAAEIYFDFNPAIATNSFDTEFVDILKIPGFDLNKVMAYPNPVNDILHISGIDAPAAITITDMQGRTILSGNGNSVRCSSLQAGTYLLSIKAEGQEKTIRFLKK